jgi:hypothetical protein
MEYPNSGALFRTKEKKHENSPDMFGSMKLDKHYIMSLIEESTGGLIEIKFSGWTAVSPTTGTKYLSLKLNTMQPTEQQAPKKEEDDDIPF